MKIETEVKIKLKDVEVVSITKKIEEKFSFIKGNKFNQKTHQFFEDDYTKQVAFPRIRNEDDGSFTLTVKVKIKDDTGGAYFKRVELETCVNDVNSAILMMPYFGYPKKISWEKNRYNFSGSSGAQVKFSVDETPMGSYLEIEGDEQSIEDAIKVLDLEKAERVTKSYLGLWEVYRKENNIDREDMLFV